MTTHAIFTASIGRLWITDGTSSGTRQIPFWTDFVNDPLVDNLTPLGDMVLFTARDRASPVYGALWFTNGTLAGTREIGGSHEAGIKGVDQENGLQASG